MNDNCPLIGHGELYRVNTQCLRIITQSRTTYLSLLYWSSLKRLESKHSATAVYAVYQPAKSQLNIAFAKIFKYSCHFQKLRYGMRHRMKERERKQGKIKNKYEIKTDVFK
jgi:IS1 family transposase